MHDDNAVSIEESFVVVLQRVSRAVIVVETVIRGKNHGGGSHHIDNRGVAERRTALKTEHVCFDDGS
jgi:hypothetical protein